jgi:CHASE2 domain-containing sensor protein
MGSRDQVALVAQWMESSWLLGIGAAGVILILLGFKRDDIMRPVFLLAGLALAAFGLGGQFLGWRF